MQRYSIIHRTYYNYHGIVNLEPHTLRLRPREDYGVHIESSVLTITPQSTIRWYRDVEGNSVAVATFTSPANRLAIESEIILVQYNENPLDFLVADFAIDYPFAYTIDEQAVLNPYLEIPMPGLSILPAEWIANLWQPGERIQTYTLLQRINTRIHQVLTYIRRDEPGVQTGLQTLTLGSGSCRDFAALFMETARVLGLAARFVSGYLHAQTSALDFGATHAWVEVYLPGAGWIGFDPTVGVLAGGDHFAVAVARNPQSVPPVAGSFIGVPGSRLDVGVWVSKC